MKALQIECHSAAWRGEQWLSRWPHEVETRVMDDTHGLPNAPVTIYVMTPDAKEAAKLLRLAADSLDREHSMCELLANPSAHDDMEVPF